MSNVWQIDRSRILDFQKCPRSRYYGYHYNGTGIQKISKSLPLVFGDAFHQAAEIFLPGGDVDQAVAKAHLFLDLTFSTNGVDLGDEKQTEYGIGEQKAIVEGLIRGWCISQRERFLEAFEVIEVEQEGRAVLDAVPAHGWKPMDIPGYEQGRDAEGYLLTRPVVPDSIVLMFRPDALVREKLTGDLYVISWKTASTFGAYTVNSCNTDMQSMSEVWGIQQQYKETANSVAGGFEEDAKADFGELRIEGVLYLFAVKGQRKLDDFLGFKTQRTHLAYCWKKLQPDEFGIHDFAWKYNYVDDEGKNRVLGKGWKLVPVWQEYPGGVKQWIADLSARSIQPRNIDPFESLFPQMLPVSRRADEIESWRRQTASNEGRVRQRVRAMEQDGSDEVLDREFPQSTARCFDYQSRCSFYECCFTPAVKADPLASGLYQIRTPNHPSEKGSED